MQIKRNLIYFLFATVLLAQGGCSTGTSSSPEQIKPRESAEQTQAETTPAEPGPSGGADPQMAHPKSAFCTDNGGKLERYVSDSGGQSEVCVFDDGSRCTAMAFWLKECTKGTCMAESGKCEAGQPNTGG